MGNFVRSGRQSPRSRTRDVPLIGFRSSRQEDRLIISESDGDTRYTLELQRRAKTARRQKKKKKEGCVSATRANEMHDGGRVSREMTTSQIYTSNGSDVGSTTEKWSRDAAEARHPRISVQTDGPRVTRRGGAKASETRRLEALADTAR